MLEYHCHIDLNQKDKWNRTIIDVASQSCREFLEGLGNTLQKILIVNKI